MMNGYNSTKLVRRSLFSQPMYKILIALVILSLAMIMLVVAASDKSASKRTRTMIVTATAYNSLPSQTTKKKPARAAWGDKLKPGMKVIAVSRDLLKQGLTRNTRVKIQGLQGEYRVLDRMSKKWRKKIDIYMGVDVKAARKWGKRKVRISWRPKK